MKHAGGLFVAVLAALLLSDAAFGYGATYRIGYGAIVAMGLMIAATFLWLWAARATPLALGMAFSWAGTAAIMGWWWVHALAGRPEAMRESALLFPFVALHMVGAVLHFDVMLRSMRLPRRVFVVPLAGALGLSAAAFLLF